METISFSTCTKELLKSTFGLRQIWESPVLDAWFDLTQSFSLEDYEMKLLNNLQDSLIRRGDDWNEFELNEYFIGPIVAIVNFNTDYFCVFAERSIEANITTIPSMEWG